MTQFQLRPDEVEALKVVLSALVLDRHGEIGILHGRDRWVTSKHGLSTAHQQALDSLARKVGTSVRRA